MNFSCASELTVVIPAAGKGTRMRHLTANKPKPLVELVSKPILQHIIEQLRDSIAAKRFVIVVGHGKEKIIDYFGNGSSLHVSIEYAEQKKQLGLAHAILQAKPFVSGVNGKGNRNFLVHLSDNHFVNPNFAEVIETHLFHEADATFLVDEVPLAKASSFGVLSVNDAGEVFEIAEKPAQPKSNLVATGFYAFSERFLQAIPRTQPSARGEYEVADAARLLMNEGGRVLAVKLKGAREKIRESRHWKDIASPEDLAETAEKIKSLKHENNENKTNEASRLDGGFV